MIHVSVLLAVLAESFVTLVLRARNEPSTRGATSLTFAHGFSIGRALLLVVRITRPTSKMSVTLGAGDSNVRERARGNVHAIATRLIACVHDVTCTRLVTPLTDELSRHRPRKISDDVVMSFHVIVQ